MIASGSFRATDSAMASSVSLPLGVGLVRESGGKHCLLRRLYAELVAKRFQRRLQIIAMAGKRQHLAASRTSRPGFPG